MIELIKTSPPCDFGKLDEIRLSLKPYAPYIAGGLYKKNKPELVKLARIFMSYNINPNYNEYTFNTPNGAKLVRLDNNQYQIVTNTIAQPMRIIAGAGSGKTTTMVCRVKFLIDHEIMPKRILLVSFNVDAKDNIKEKLFELFGFDISVEVKTIDSFLTKIIKQYDISHTCPTNISTNEFGKYAKQVLEQNIELCNSYSHIFIDEFQDISHDQFSVFELFANNGCVLTVVGDDNQNIYQWRGSSNYYMINFDKLIKNSHTHNISTNYRSCKNIIEIANASISNNKVRIDKSMVPFNNTDGTINLDIFATGTDQLQFIIQTIKDLKGLHGYTNDSFAILSPNTFYLKYLETEFTKKQISHICLLTDKDNFNESVNIKKPDSITLSTIYRAKGLEWNTVFLVGLADEFFPSHLNNNLANIEEDRRLFYVGLTRAKSHLYLCGNAKDLPLSRFIEEVKSHITMKTHTEKISGLFGSNNNNAYKKSYGVVELVKSLKSTDYSTMRTRGLLPEITIKENKIFDIAISQSDSIRTNYLESDFGEFADRLATRNIMIQNSHKLYDTDTEFFLAMPELKGKEFEIWNKYELEKFISQPISKLTQWAKLNIKGPDSYISDNIINKLEKSKLLIVPEIRREFTIPSQFKLKLAEAYTKFINPRIKSEDILHDIYLVSLCRTFGQKRFRLVYRDVFSLFTNGFDIILNRINKYINEHIQVVPNNTICKIPLCLNIPADASVIVKLSGEIDYIKGTSICDLKFSNKAQCNIEWVIQVLLYYVLYRETGTELETKPIDSLQIINILSGIEYTIDIDPNYNTKPVYEFIQEFFLANMLNIKPEPELSVSILTENMGELDLSDLVDRPNKVKIDLEHLIANNDNINPCNNIMCLDVETNDFGPESDIIQLAYILYDPDLNQIKEFNKYISGSVVSGMAYGVHKISSEYLKTHGETFAQVFGEFLADLSKTEKLIGHNISSDISHITYNIKNKTTLGNEIFANKEIIDTMKLGKNICNLKNKSGKIKSPSLSELYFWFHNTNLNNAHDALCDCHATMECYKKIIKYKNFENINV